MKRLLIFSVSALFFVFSGVATATPMPTVQPSVEPSVSASPKPTPTICSDVGSVGKKCKCEEPASTGDPVTPADNPDNSKDCKTGKECKLVYEGGKWIIACRDDGNSNSPVTLQGQTIVIDPQTGDIIGYASDAEADLLSEDLGDLVPRH